MSFCTPWSVASCLLKTLKHQTSTRRSWLENSNYHAFSRPTVRTSCQKSCRPTLMIAMALLRFVNTPGTANLETSNQWACSLEVNSCLWKTTSTSRFSTNLVLTQTTLLNALRLIGTITSLQRTTCYTSAYSASKSPSLM